MITSLYSLLSFCFGTLNGVSAQDAVVLISPARTTVSCYEPLNIGIGVQNVLEKRVAVMLGIVEDVMIERRADSGWVDISTEKITYRFPHPDNERLPSYRIPAGETLWLQRRVLDQRILLTAGTYRIRARAYIGGKVLWSKWASVQVEESAINKASLKPGSLNHSIYLTVILMGQGFLYRSALGLMPDKIFGPAMRAMSGIQISRHLRERLSVLEAQRLVSRAHDASRKQDKVTLLGRAAVLLKGCNVEEYKGATGGLGPEILLTKALCEEEAGQHEECRKWCLELIRRYPGSCRVLWARERIRLLKKK